MKKTKIILLATLGMCMLSFIPAVLGKADKRPISAFTDTNEHVAAWGDPQSGLVITPHGAWWHPQTIADYIHSGSVLERELKDGRILYKVNLHVKGALMWVHLAEPFWPEKEPILVGEMDYSLTATIIVDGEIGDDVPTFWMIWFGFYPGEAPFVHITGSGTGEFTEYGEFLEFGFEGDSAKVKLNQVAIGKPPEHPQIDPDYDPYNMWPVELVFLH